MSLRLLEIYHQKGKADEIDFLLKDLPMIETWHYHLEENNESVTKVLLRSESTDSILDVLHKFFPDERHIRIVILPVEATLPRPEEPIEEKKQDQPKEKSPQRISMEELYQKMTVVSGLSRKFMVMAAVATFVAGIGLLKNDVAIIIGSMVIAPLLYPNMALSFATTLADIQLAQRAIKTNIIGFFLVLIISITMGLFMEVDPSTPQIVARSNVSHFYIFLALASGIAGAYSITAGVAEALVGVMVAVAILPPLVAAGLLLGGHYWINATGALLLCFVNIVSVNLAGVVTFLIEGIQPKKWWEAEKARKAVWVAIPVWIILLLILVILIYIEQNVRSM